MTAAARKKPASAANDNSTAASRAFLERFRVVELSPGCQGEWAPDGAIRLDGVIIEGVKGNLICPRPGILFLRTLDGQKISVLEDEVEPEEPAAARPTTKLSDFTRPGGVLQEMVDWITASATEPCRELALGASIAFLGALMGRRYGTTDRDTRANVYCVGLAPSGFGKEHARSQIKRLVAAGGGYLDKYEGPSRFKSSSALRVVMEKSPAVICMLDEFGSFIRGITDQRAGTHQTEISADLREFFSSSSTSYGGAAYAEKDAQKIYNPNLNIYGTATPDQFWRALSSASAEDGLLPRLLLFQVEGALPPLVKPERPVSDVPQPLVERLLSIAGVQPRVDAPRTIGAIQEHVAKESGQAPLDPVSVPWTDDAEGMLLDTIRSLRIEAAAGASEYAPFINRIAEYAIKLSLIAAVGRAKSATGNGRPLIDLPTFEWGLGLARHCVSEMVVGVRGHVADTPYQREYKQTEEVVRRAGSNGISPSRLTDKISASRRQTRKEVIADLTEAQRVRLLQKQTSGRPLTRYVHRDCWDAFAGGEETQAA